MNFFLENKETSLNSIKMQCIEAFEPRSVQELQKIVGTNPLTIRWAAFFLSLGLKISPFKRDAFLEIANKSKTPEIETKIPVYDFCLTDSSEYFAVKIIENRTTLESLESDMLFYNDTFQDIESFGSLFTNPCKNFVFLGQYPICTPDGIIAGVFWKEYEGLQKDCVLINGHRDGIPVPYTESEMVLVWNHCIHKGWILYSEDILRKN